MADTINETMFATADDEMEKVIVVVSEVDVGLASSLEEDSSSGAEWPFLESMNSPELSPDPDMEDVMRGLWGEELNIEPDSVNPEDTFFSLGGDSIAAMQLAAAARDEGFELTVADIFA